MLPNFYNIAASDIDHRTPNTFCRVDNDVVVLRHVECIERFDFLARPIQHPLINCIRYAIVDQFGQHQAVFTFVEHLKGICREGKAAANVRISSQDGVDVSCEFRSLILIDGMCDIGRRALYLYPSGHAPF